MFQYSKYSLIPYIDFSYLLNYLLSIIGKMLLTFNECYLMILLSWRLNLLRLGFSFGLDSQENIPQVVLQFSNAFDLEGTCLRLQNAFGTWKKSSSLQKLLSVFKIFTYFQSSSNPHGLSISNWSSRSLSLIIFKGLSLVFGNLQGSKTPFIFV